MAKLIDRTAEKLELAKELGITSYIAYQESELAKKEREAKEKSAIEELTRMKFKPITMKEIRAKFPKFGWVAWEDDVSIQLLASFGFSGLGLVAGLLLALINMGITGKDNAPLALVLTPIVVAIIGLHIFNRVRRIQVASMYLNNWRDNLPYGALLAIKEAKEAGITGEKETRFYHGKNTRHDYSDVGYSGCNEDCKYVTTDVGYKIYYPKLEERVKADPVITGWYKGVEVCIFFWDDGKVYE